jgi:hypothetical protein
MCREFKTSLGGYGDRFYVVVVVGVRFHSRFLGVKSRSIDRVIGVCLLLLLLLLLLLMPDAWVQLCSCQLPVRTGWVERSGHLSTSTSSHMPLLSCQIIWNQ